MLYIYGAVLYEPLRIRKALDIKQHANSVCTCRISSRLRTGEVYFRGPGTVCVVAVVAGVEHTGEVSSTTSRSQPRHVDKKISGSKIYQKSMPEPFLSLGLFVKR